MILVAASDPSTVSGVLGLVALFVVAAVLLLTIEWICEREDW